MTSQHARIDPTKVKVEEAPPGNMQDARDAPAIPPPQPIRKRVKVEREPESTPYKPRPPNQTTPPPPMPTNATPATTPTESEDRKPDTKCSICWSEPPSNAVQLSCRHLFCFLCIKSVATGVGLCPLCRSDIEQDFKVGEFEVVGQFKLPEPSQGGHYWFYEGRRGWWMYDAETNRELEQAYQRDAKRIEKMIAGQLYVISLHQMKQYRKIDDRLSRSICRQVVANLPASSVLGVAGLRNRNLLEMIGSQSSSSSSSSATTTSTSDAGAATRSPVRF